ncbi:MAG TPA: polysaccharide deacetylase family protein [Vicinamibacteria bacterium]|jgi:peptidoglycan/xylan/chitin deacetylase (PgdA/CDA1 family)
MSPKLLVTIDTELSSFPAGQGLWGRVDGEEWGLARLLGAFREEGVVATFFLDAYGGNDADRAEQRRAAERIVGDGHDLQLHTHPGPSFDRSRPRLRDYDEAGQEEILEHGGARLEEWTGRRPTLHRAGDWAVDERSMAALGRRGFRGDFSACLWSRECRLEPRTIAGNGWTRRGSLLCGVGTCYRDALTGRIRRLDLGGVSFSEVEEVVSLAIDPLILTLHSFSLLRYDRTRTRFAPDREYLARLRRFLRHAREGVGYEVTSAVDAVSLLEKRPAEDLPWAAFPTSGLGASCAGLLKSLGDRVRR